MPERAEIEAVARALAQDELGGESGWPAYRKQAAVVLEYLDRVRDARGDDEGRCNCPDLYADSSECPVHGSAARSPQGEDHEDR